MLTARRPGRYLRLPVITHPGKPAPLFESVVAIAGNYELSLPGQHRLLFADTLEGAAHDLVAHGPQLVGGPGQFQARVAHVLQLLRGGVTRGVLKPGGRGMHFLCTGPTGEPLIAQVRGGRPRTAPLFTVGDLVFADPQRVCGAVPTTRGMRVQAVYVTDHPSEDRVYVYDVDGHHLRQGQLLRTPFGDN